MNAREHGLRYVALDSSLNSGGLGLRYVAPQEVMCSVCGVVLPFDETVKAICCECWFRDCPLSVHEGTPPGSARGSCQVVDWVLPADEIASGSLVFPRMSFVENSVSDDAACS